MSIPSRCALRWSLVSPLTPSKTMSDDIKTMAAMVAHRAADIETTRKIEEQKQKRLEMIKAHCRTLTGENRSLMQEHYPELFTDNGKEVAL